MEENVINLAKKGNEDAFESIVEEYKTEMYSIATVRLKNMADVEDAIQETLFDIYKNLWYLKRVAGFKSWIIKILINNCNDIIRQKKESVLSFEDSVVNTLPDKENEYLKLEGEQNFFELINFLNEEEKTIMTMRYSQDFSINEMSKILNIREGTLRMRISRIKEKIRNRYEDK